MQKQGTVLRWDGTRGFGFIRSPGTAADIFFHAKDYRGPGLPSAGQTVWFEEIHMGGKGPRAMAVHTAEARSPLQPIGASRQRSSEPRRRARQPQVARDASSPGFILTATLAWAAVWLYGVWAHRLPWWTLGAAVAVNLMAFIAYWSDKHAAQTGQWRTREDHLHLLGLLGGWPGARLAQWIFRHKSSKPAFQATYWATVAAHGTALAAWVFWPWLR